MEGSDVGDGGKWLFPFHLKVKSSSWGMKIRVARGGVASYWALLKRVRWKMCRAAITQRQRTMRASHYSVLFRGASNKLRLECLSMRHLRAAEMRIFSASALHTGAQDVDIVKVIVKEPLSASLCTAQPTPQSSHPRPNTFFAYTELWIS